MTRTGNTGQVVTGVSGAFHNNFFKIAYAEDCDKWFLYYFLTSHRTQHAILKLAGTSTIPDLNHGDFYKIKINTPFHPEQKKVASFLSAVDRRIEELEKKRDLLTVYKKGLMQQLFSQSLRFKDDQNQPFPDWEEKRLGEICSDFSYGANSAAVPYDGVNKYIRITDIDDESRMFVPSPLSSPADAEGEKYKLCDGDIVFARTGASVGKSYLYKKNDGNLVYAGFLIKISVTGADPYFVYFNTLRYEYKKWVQIMSTRSGQPGINAEEYKTFTIPFPCLAEQKKIAECLSAVDRKIEQVSAQVSQTREFKQGLLQRMFV